MPSTRSGMRFGISAQLHSVASEEESRPFILPKRVHVRQRTEAARFIPKIAPTYRVLSYAVKHIVTIRYRAPRVAALHAWLRVEPRACFVRPTRCVVLAHRRDWTFRAATAAPSFG